MKEMATFCFLLCSILMFRVSQARDGYADEDLSAARQHSGDYFVNNFQFIPDMRNALYYHPLRSRLPVYGSLYRSRNPFIRPQLNTNPYKKYLFQSGAEGEENGAENYVPLGLLDNRFRSASTQRIANFYTPESCQSSSGESGICVPRSVCSIFGGNLGDPCSFGKVCCINSVNSCGGSVTFNNTYWQSPSTGVSASSTCALNVQLDTSFLEQLRTPICQIRLDFISFTTAQPSAGTCTDTFTVVGTTTVPPTICGDNSGQHMYLDVPSSSLTPIDVQLIFNFASGIASRSWNIKVAMLPCGATYLAPADCLQYFTAASGTVKSFNWQDVAGGATRQLNNQNYNICFRSELLSSRRATQICLSVCDVANGGDAFYITTPTSADVAAAAAAVDAATTVLEAAQTILADAQDSLDTAQATLANAQAALTNAQNTLIDTQNALAAAQSDLATAQAALTVAQTALTTAQSSLTDTQTALTTAQETLTASQTALSAAQTDLDNAIAAVVDPADPTAAEMDAIAAAQAAVDTAQAAANDAQIAVYHAQTTVDDAQIAVDNAQNDVDDVQTAASVAQTAIDNAQLKILDDQIAITVAQAAVDSAQTDVDNAQAVVDAAQPDVDTAQAALTAAETALANVFNAAAALSAVGTNTIVDGVDTAACLYDFLLIAGARDSTNVEADRYCGNALNPAATPVATSVPVCTSINPFKMTYRTDGTEGAVASGVNVLPAPADSGNVGFCLDYQET